VLNKAATLSNGNIDFTMQIMFNPEKFLMKSK